MHNAQLGNGEWVMGNGFGPVLRTVLIFIKKYPNHSKCQEKRSFSTTTITYYLLPINLYGLRPTGYGLRKDA